MAGETTWLTRRMATATRSAERASGAKRPQSAIARSESSRDAVIDHGSSHSRGSVLVVEDELDIQELLSHTLTREGYRVTCCGRGEHALEQVDSNPPDLVLLDLMLPGIDGMDVCRRLKSNPETSTIPVIMLTARGEEADIVAGLEIGADDYMSKPFATRTMLARVKAVLRRHQRQKSAHDSDEDDARPIQVGPLVIRPDRHETRLDGEPIELTATEFRLITLLARKPGRVFTRQQIIVSIHGDHVAVTDRSVDVQILHLRRKLGQRSDLIEAVRGVGYRCRED